MTAWRERWDAHWFARGSAVDLAVFRVVLIGWHLAALGSRSYFERLDALAAKADEAFQAPFLLQLCTLGSRPSPDAMALVHAVALVAAAVALIGWRTRASVAVLAAATLALRAYEAGFPPVQHHAALPALALALLALSPCGDALAIDALRRAGRPRGPAWRWAWPLRLVAWLLALAYASSVTSKLVTSGLEWANGATLQFYAYYRGMPRNRPLGVWLSGEPALAAVLSWGALAFESTFLLAVLRPRLRWIYVPLGIAFHVLGDLFFGADFSGFVALYAALVPWERAFVRTCGRWRGAGRGLDRAVAAQRHPVRLHRLAEP